MHDVSHGRRRIASSGGSLSSAHQSRRDGHWGERGLERVKLLLQVPQLIHEPGEKGLVELASSSSCCRGTLREEVDV